MSLPTISRSKLFITWVTLIAAALLITPAFSQVATPNAVTFYYTYTQGAPGQAPSPIPVAFTDGSGNAISVTSISFVQPTYVNSSGQTQTANAFIGQVSGTSVYVAVDLSGISTIGNNILALGGSYAGTMNVVTSAGAIAVPVTLNINTSGSSTITASPSSLALAVVSGGSTQSIIGLSGATVNFTATASTVNGINWLTVTPSGTVTPSSIVVTVSAAALTNGQYVGYVNIIAGGATLQVPVTLNVGTTSGGGLVANPASVSMSVLSNLTSTSATVNLTSSTFATQYTATINSQTGGSTWLTFGSGQVFTTGTFSVGTGGFVLYANPVSLTTGTYTASVVVTSYPDGASTTIPVYLSVGTGGGTGVLSISPASVTLNAPTLFVSPASQTVTITSPASNTFYQATVTSSGWLTVNGTTFASGVLSNSGFLVVGANTSSLPAGSYSGQINISTSGGVTTTATIPVTLIVGSGGGNTGLLTITPSSVSFSAPTLNVSPTAQYVTLTAPVSNTTYVATPSSSGWLTVNNTTYVTGVLSNSGSILVGANTVGLAAGNYTGQINISTSGGTVTTATIFVYLTVGSGGTGTGGTVAPSSLTFSGQANGQIKPGVQYIAVSGSGSFTATATTSSGSGWIILESNSGSAPSWITVSVNTAGLGVGSYAGNVVVTANGVTTNVPVALNLTQAPAVTANPSGIFTNAYSGATPPTQTFYITMSDTSAGLTFNATSASSWITVSPATGTLNGSAGAGLVVQVNASGLASGLNTGTITITVAGAANTPLTIPVTVNNQGGGGVNPGTGYLSFSQGSLDFTSTGVTTQGLLVSSPTLGSAFFSATASTTTGANWLYVAPSSAVTPSTVTVSVSSAGLAQGVYYGTLSFVSNGLTQNLQVTLTVGAGAQAIIATPTTLSFEAQGSTAPAAQSISLTSTSGAVSWSASVSSNASWLTLSPGAGALPGSTQVSVNPAGLSAGSYTGTITFNSTSGVSTSVSVNLTVRANPNVTASPVSLTYSYRAGDAVPGTQQIQVTAQSSTTPLSWSASVTSGNSWLSISPTSGSTAGTINVNVTPGSLDPGTYTGAITVTGTGGASGSTTINVSITVTAPLPSINRVVNAASYVAGALSPGEIFVITGTAIGPNETVLGSLDSSTGRWTTTVGGVQVLVNGFLAPVLYATNGQVAGIVPFAISGRLDAFVQVRFRGLTSNTLTVSVTSTAPGLFTANSAGSGPAAALNEDGSLNSAGNPVTKGRVIALFGTGDGIEQNPAGARPETGQVVNVSSVNDLPRPLLPVAVLIDGQPATVTYMGQAPGQIAGLFQLNVIVPSSPNSGAVSVQITVGGQTTQSGVTIAVR